MNKLQGRNATKPKPHPAHDMPEEFKGVNPDNVYADGFTDGQVSMRDRAAAILQGIGTITEDVRAQSKLDSKIAEVTNLTIDEPVH